jgi:hypothetical protein
MEVVIVLVTIAVVMFSIVVSIARFRDRAYNKRMAAKAAKSFVPSPPRPTGLEGLQLTLQERLQVEQNEKENAERADEKARLDEISYRTETENAWAAHSELIAAAIARVQKVLVATNGGTLKQLSPVAWHDPSGGDSDTFNAWYGITLDGPGSGSIWLYCERDMLTIQPLNWKGEAEDVGSGEFQLSQLTEQKLADALADALLPSVGS